MYLDVALSDAKCTFIVDTGSDISIIKAHKIKINHTFYPNDKCTITGIGHDTVHSQGSIQTHINFPNLHLEQKFHIVDNNFPIPTDGILGRDFLTKYRCKIDFDPWLLTLTTDQQEIAIPIEDNFKQTLYLPARHEVTRYVPTPTFYEDMVVHAHEILPGIFCGSTIISPKQTFYKFINTTNTSIYLAYQDFKPTLEPLKNFSAINPKNLPTNKNERRKQILKDVDTKHISPFARKELEKLLINFEDIFNLEGEPLTTNNFYTQNINLNDNTPVYIPNYRTIHSQGQEIETQVQKMLTENIIEHSVSSYNSPILLVPKKSDTQEKKWRLVVDFRQLNKKIMPDKFPLPRIESILDQLGRAKYFTTLDLMSGFHQIPLDENSRRFTAFSTNSGHYHFKRLPFGLNISPNSFQRMMAIAMAGLTPEKAFIYIDDIVVIGCSLRHHLTNLGSVFTRLRKYNLKLNISKCKFLRTEVTYLGHKITDKGILPDDAKFDTIKNYPVPKNADDVRRFVAFCNYYRKFVENFATIAYPLNQLLKKKAIFAWTPECQRAFDSLRYSLIQPQILQYPDFTNKFIVTTDASDIGCGAVLSQVTQEGDRPIAFASKTFTPAEKNKTTILKELTAIHWAINYFKPYLYGRRFIVHTDHRPLAFHFGMKNPTSKLTRIRIDLEEFDYDVVYIKGKENVVADALSRITTTSEELKHTSMLVINTRAMTRNKAKINQRNNNEVKINKEEPDQLQIYETESPTEIRKIMKLSTAVETNTLKMMILKSNSKRLVASVHQDLRNGSQILEFALLQIEKITKMKRINKLALSADDYIFQLVPLNYFKLIANNILKDLQIIIFKEPKFIDNPVEIQNILINNHNTPTGGHVGQHRLYLRIREKYKWRDMKGSIAQFVNACELCRRNKIIKHTKEPMKITTTPNKAFEIISIDTVGPLPKTDNNNRYCITIQCDLTKYIVIIPIQNKEANTIAKALVENFILTYGHFLEMRSDQGTEYKNEILEQVCKLLQIRQNFSTPYHPESIGSLERNHRCLNEYLRIFTNEHQSDWDNWIQYYQFSYNTTPHSDHNFTPFELIFGRKANLPQDIITGNNEPIYNFEQYKNELQYKLRKSHEITKQKLIEQKIERKKHFDNNINPIAILVNDLVYLKNENRKKLDSFYTGPYQITLINEPNCEIKHVNSGKTITVHKNRIIKS